MWPGALRRLVGIDAAFNAPHDSLAQNSAKSRFKAKCTFPDQQDNRRQFFNIDRDNNAGNNNIAERHKRNDHTAKAGDPFYTTENNEA